MSRILEGAELPHAASECLAWLGDADRVLIGAGAGLSVAAGIDYTDEADFGRRFPTLVRRGIRARYQMIGYDALPTTAFWAYWANHVLQVRFSDGTSPVYRALEELTRNKDRFVLTSNVDALFERNGFDTDRLCSIQGDYGFLQCLRPCTRTLWPSGPVLEAVAAATDPTSQEVTVPSALPTCPSCGGEVFLNVRGGNWFVDTPWTRQMVRLQRWLSTSQGRLVVIDIGSGFNTPSVVRWPMERVTAGVPAARLVRINPAHPAVPVELGYRAMGVKAGAAEFIHALHRARTLERD